MDEAAFKAALSRFPVVRSRDWQAGRVRVKRRFGGASAAGSAPRAALPAPSSAGSAAPPKDFWGGLEAFLAAHYDPAAAKAVASAFDALHYDGVRALNFEDVEDATRMLCRETGVAWEAQGAAQ